MPHNNFSDLISPIWDTAQTNKNFSKSFEQRPKFKLISLEDFRTRFSIECLEGSAIDSSLYDVAIQIVSDLEIITHDVTSPLHDALNWNYSRFGYQANATLHAALFLNEDGSCWQAKLANPKPDRKKGGIRKYETPIGNGSRAFFPAIDIKTWIHIAQTNQLTEFLPTWVLEAHTNGQYHRQSRQGSDRSFWNWVADLPQARITLTEGGKKSLALLSQGEIAIALYGVNGGYRSNAKIGGEVIPLEKPELIADLVRFVDPDRAWTLAFDQDLKLETNQKVDRALSKFGTLLAQSSQTVTVATWHNSNGQCKGIDDLLVHTGVAAWHTAQTQALPLLEWQLLQNVATRIRRKPDWSIEQQEFSTIDPKALPVSGILALHGGKGTAKSKAIRPLLAHDRWLSLTTLQSLGRHQASSFKGTFLNDGDQTGNTLLKDGAPALGVILCLHSLLKVTQFEPEVLVLDEYTSILECLFSSPLTNKDGIRALLITEFIRRVQSARLVIVADADLTEECLRFLEDIRGERTFLVQSSRKALPYSAHILDGGKHTALASLIDRAEAMDPRQLITLNSDSKTFGQSLAKLLEAQGHKCLLINADTSGGELQSQFIQSSGKLLPDLVSQGYRFIISSPSITQGFSIEHCTDSIDSFWGFYFGGSITVEAIAQACDRIRDAQVPRFLSIATRGRAYSKHSQATHPKTFLREFKSITTASARLVRHQLTPETLYQCDTLDWNGLNLKMFATLESQRNRGMKNLRNSVVALLRYEGKTVTFSQPSVNRSQIQVVAQAFKVANQARQQEHAIAIQNACVLNEAEVQRLNDRQTIYSPEEILSLERYHINLFYHLQQNITTEDILFDRQGRTRHQVTLLEQVLRNDNALDRTRRSIETSPTTPQDWNTDAGKLRLIELSGTGNMVRRLMTREIQEWDNRDIAPIVTFMRENSAAFKLAFGYSKMENMADQQIFGRTLSALGLKTKRFRRRSTYACQENHLEKILEILKRRQDEDPPRLDYDLIASGGSRQISPASVPEPQKIGFIHPQEQVNQSDRLHSPDDRGKIP